MEYISINKIHFIGREMGGMMSNTESIFHYLATPFGIGSQVETSIPPKNSHYTLMYLTKFPNLPRQEVLEFRRCRVNTRERC